MKEEMVNDDAVDSFHTSSHTPSSVYSVKGRRELWTETRRCTYKIANFLGLRERIGISVKQTTNRARAAMLRPPKTSRRSHRLTRLVSAYDWIVLCLASGKWQALGGATGAGDVRQSAECRNYSLITKAWPALCVCCMSRISLFA